MPTAQREERIEEPARFRPSLAFAVLAALALAACTPVSSANDAWSSGGGGGGGAVSRAGWATEGHEPTTPRVARDEPIAHATSRSENLDMRPPRTGIVFCNRCQ